MHNSWTIVSVVRGPGMLNDSVRYALIKSACMLALHNIDSMRISEPNCEGSIETEWKTYSVEARSGILFRSVIEHADGTYKVNFLVRRAELDLGAERLKEMEESVFPYHSRLGPIPDLPELRDFSPLRTSPSLH